MADYELPSGEILWHAVFLTELANFGPRPTPSSIPRRSSVTVRVIQVGLVLLMNTNDRCL